MGLFDLGKKNIEGDNETQSEKDRDLAKHVRDKVEEIRGSANRISHEGIWMTNIAYLLGYDGVAWNTQSRSFMPINRASSALKKGKLHVNKILPTIQNRLARLCKNPPKYDVRPESNDTEDKEAARLGLQTIGVMWEKLNLNQKRLALYMWTQQCGHSYMRVGWDTELGDPVDDPETGEVMFEGDLSADVFSSFEVFPDPLARSFEDALKTYIITAKVRKLDYFKAHYPEYGHMVKEEGAWLLSAQYEDRINTMNTRGPNASTTNMKNCAIELVKYEARSSKYPTGRLIITANGVLLENKELPVGEIPFARFDDVVIGGKYYPDSIITHLRPVQDAYNENRRRVSDWSRRLMSGKYITARGSGLAQESLNDQSAEVIYYDPVPNAADAGRPIPLQTPSIPQWAFQEEGLCDKEINDISGISEVSRGSLPAAGIPAIGMQLLTEQDDTRIGVMTEQHEIAWARVGSLILKYVENFYTTPRKIKIAGQNQSYAVKELTGEMLRGNTDAIVIRGSTLPGSKTLSRQDILGAYREGLLGDQADPKVREKVLSMIEFGDASEMYQDYALDMGSIKKGIESIEASEPVIVSEFDNHTLWIQELNRYRKGDKFNALNPVQQAELLRVMNEHLDFAAGTNVQPPPDVQPEDMLPQAKADVDANPGLVDHATASNPEAQPIEQMNEAQAGGLPI